MNLLDFVERLSARLDQAGVCFGQGTLTAFDEAAWLVLWHLGLPLDGLDEHREIGVGDSDIDDGRAPVVSTLVAGTVAVCGGRTSRRGDGGDDGGDCDECRSNS